MVETETKTRPKRNGKLSLYPLKSQDALRALEKAKPKRSKASSAERGVEFTKR